MKTTSPRLQHTLVGKWFLQKVQVLISRRHDEWMGKHSCPSPESQKWNPLSPWKALSVHKVCCLLRLALTNLATANFDHSVWAPIRGPVQDWPLALCDASSLNPHSLHAGDVVFQDFQTENLLLEYHPQHQWYYASEQMPNEAWVFLQGDSKGSSCQ